MAQPQTNSPLNHGKHQWYKGVTGKQWRALIAAGSGWALDAMDVMLYSMILFK